jgi:hypothetical protein
MARYGTRPKAEWDDDVPLLPSLDVPEHEPAWTGLVDAKGEPIFRYPRPVGFGRDKEWA